MTELIISLVLILLMFSSLFLFIWFVIREDQIQKENERKLLESLLKNLIIHDSQNKEK